MTEYKTPSVTADIFIFDEEINFILVKRKNNPFRDYWALPGGFVEYGESVENGAIREAKEETNIDVTLKDTGDMSKMKADTDAKEVKIFSAEKLDEINIAFDHDKIIRDCLKKVKTTF